MKQDEQSWTKMEPLWLFALMIGFIVSFLACYWYWLSCQYPMAEEVEKAQALRGQFGDMFGGANAVFSGMAFAVLIYTMWLQRKELQLQREELRETRVELARTAAAQEKAEHALSLQVEAMKEQVESAAAQAEAMKALARATHDQASYERTLAEASRKQADAMGRLASVINDIKWKIK